MTTRVAVVTGGNKGVGFGIVEALCKKFQGIVYLTARDVGRGMEAVKKLEAAGLNPKFHQLDITDKGSIIALRDYLQNHYGGLDVLVNNAAIAFKRTSTEPYSVQAKETLRVNYFSLVDVCHELFPLLRPHARVVNVSSAAGQLCLVPSESLKQELLNPDMTEEQLTALMQEFVDLAQEGKQGERGWPQKTYCVSKCGVTKLSFIQQREFDKDSREDLVVNAVHPGYVDTDMTNHEGVFTIERGALAPTYLALLPPNVKEPRGQFVWDDTTILGWNDPTPGIPSKDVPKKEAVQTSMPRCSIHRQSGIQLS